MFFTTKSTFVRFDTRLRPLSDLKLHLAGTDYGSFLANEPSPLSVSVIDDKLREKLVIEFQHLRNHSVQPLSTFLDFITYSYMIDNIILLITGTLHQRPISELIPKCHPLGSFEQMEAIHVAATPAELYNAVLVDTPLGEKRPIDQIEGDDAYVLWIVSAPFFVDCISEQDLDEMNIEIIRNTLYKAYLEAFYKFCSAIGGTTADTMCEILQFEADRRAIIITINSFGTELGKDDRAKLYPRCGRLNPDGLAALARADDYDQVKAVAEYYAVSYRIEENHMECFLSGLLCLQEYSALFDGAGNNPGDKTLEDKFFEHEVITVDLLVSIQCQQSDFSILVSGPLEHACFPSAIPLRSVLQLLEAKGTGMSQHSLDFRMRCSETSRQDRQLHTDILIPVKPDRSRIPPQSFIINIFGDINGKIFAQANSVSIYFTFKLVSFPRAYFDPLPPNSVNRSV